MKGGKRNLRIKDLKMTFHEFIMGKRFKTQSKEIEGCGSCPHAEMSNFDGRSNSPSFGYFLVSCCHPNASDDLYFTNKTPNFRWDVCPPECPLLKN